MGRLLPAWRRKERWTSRAGCVIHAMGSGMHSNTCGALTDRGVLEADCSLLPAVH